MAAGAPVVVNEGDHHDDLMDLPPGFRFHPTDEEIITHYLTEKVMNNGFSATAIGEVDLNKCEPWDLPKKAKMGEKEWFFFCQRDRKYPTGMRTNRATESGYWKATGKDKEIYKQRQQQQQLVGMKKTLVFYKGRAPKGEKTNWVMHEFRLDGKFSYYTLPNAAKDEWVVCRVFHKNTGIKRSPIATDLIRMNYSFVDDLFDFSPSALPPLMDPPNDRPTGSSFTNTIMNGNKEEEEEEEEEEFNGSATEASSERSSDGNYLSYFSNHQLVQQDHHNYYTFNTASYQAAASPSNFNYQPSNIFYSQIAYQQRQGGSSSSSAGLGNNNNWLHHQETERIMRQCKVEQLSSTNQSTQDTGLSTDMATEISSSVQAAAGRSNRTSSSSSYQHLDDAPNSVAPLSDLDSVWNYY